MTENDIYLMVCDRLLEPGGLQLGVLTQAQFHAYFVDVLADFCRSTGVVKLFSTQTINTGQGAYVFSDRQITVESVFTSGRFIPRSDLETLDNAEFQWRNRRGPVKVFHEDGLPIKTLEAVPAPDWQGTLVTDPSGYEYLDAFSSPGTIPAAERNLTVYGSQIPTGLTVCEPSVSALTLKYTDTVPPSFRGFDFGSTPVGEFGFEYNGAEYVFLTQEAGSFLSDLMGGSDFKVHALRSPDKGLTWTDLDLVHAPDILPNPSGAGGGDYTVARDGSTVLVFWINHVSYDGGRQRLGLANTALNAPCLSLRTFSLTTGLWSGTTRSFYGKIPSYAWQPNVIYAVGATVTDGAGHTQVALVRGSSGSTTPAFSDSGGNIVEGHGALQWRESGIAVTAWVAATDYSGFLYLLDSGGFLQRRVSGGVSGGVVPTWNHSTFGTTADGTITWECQGFGLWISHHNYSFFDNPIVDPAGHIQSPTAGGISAAVEPTWNNTSLGITYDGDATLTWQDIGITGGIPPWVAGLTLPRFSGIVDSGGHLQQVTTAGTTGGTVPVWNHAGGTTADGSVIWTDLGVAVPGVTLDVIQVQSFYFIQLLIRAPGDYLFYYAGARELLSNDPVLYSRLYCATFNGTAFGPEVILPGQSGFAVGFEPLSAAMDSSHIAHFLYVGGVVSGPVTVPGNLPFTGQGQIDAHVALRPNGTFDTPQVITQNDNCLSGVTSGSQSKLITFPGPNGESMAYVTGTWEPSEGNDAGSIRMFLASAGVNPVWTSTVISGPLPVDPSTHESPYWSYIAPRQGDAIPQNVALQHVNGILACVWSVSTNPFFAPVSGESSTWWWSHAAVSGLVWSAPALLITAPPLTTPFPVWDPAVSYSPGDLVRGLPSHTWSDGTFKALLSSTGVEPGPIVVPPPWTSARYDPGAVYGQQVAMFPMSTGIGVVTAWMFDDESQITLFSFLEYSSTIGHCTQMIPDSAILYLGWLCLAKIYSDNSELKDTQKAAYCAARGAEGINLFKAIMIEEIEDQQE